MSFILDALRRAESERERAALPGLHARPVPLAEGAAGAARGAGRLGWVVAGLSVLALLAVLGWQRLSTPVEALPAVPGAARGGGAVASASAPAGAPAEPTPGQAPERYAPVDSAAPPAVLPAAPPAAVAPRRPPAVRPAQPVQRAEAPPRARAPAAAPERRAAAAPAPRASAALPSAAVPASAPSAAVAASAAAAAPRLPGVADLPPAVRATLPALAIGGLVYSDTPARRFVVINGQIYHEGGEPATGVVVEQIKPKGAVLRYQGYRYEVGY